jgi:hypothetical protein
MTASLPSSEDYRSITSVAMENSLHYWQNLYVELEDMAPIYSFVVAQVYQTCQRKKELDVKIADRIQNCMH